MKKIKFLDYVFSEKYGKGMVHCAATDNYFGVLFNNHREMFWYNQYGVGLVDKDELKHRSIDADDERYSKRGIRIIEE